MSLALQSASAIYLSTPSMFPFKIIFFGKSLSEFQFNMRSEFFFPIATLAQIRTEHDHVIKTPPAKYTHTEARIHTWLKYGTSIHPSIVYIALIQSRVTNPS